MKNGKISDAVLNRSVLSVITHRREEVVKTGATGEDCSMIKDGEDGYIVMSTDPVTGAKEGAGKLAVDVTVNDIASSGAEPVGVMLSILLPPGFSEKKLKALMEDAEAAAAASGVEILGGHTEVTSAVNQVIITATGIGRTDKTRMTPTSGSKPGDDVVLTKWIALEGSSILAKERRELLLTRLPEELLDRAAAFDKYMSVLPEARIAVKYGAHAMHDVTEGGVFGALWEIAEACGHGITADVRSIPIKQESVEICEFFDINPYNLVSSGSMLITLPDGYGLVRALDEAGIHASVIGKITEDKTRTVRMDETERVLTPPEPDELYKALGMKV